MVKEAPPEAATGFAVHRPVAASQVRGDSWRRQEEKQAAVMRVRALLDPLLPDGAHQPSLCLQPGPHLEKHIPVAQLLQFFLQSSDFTQPLTGTTTTPSRTSSPSRDEHRAWRDTSGFAKNSEIPTVMCAIKTESRGKGRVRSEL
ncbi:hypothetical protein MC885_019359 [Smutsia gigantea]|nr:hypothetical protein MC885_019359 [Smutsia gigantea]